MMPRASEWVLIACAGLLLAAAGPVVAGDAAAGRPNVVFLLADDLGWGDLRCYGHDRIRSPNLDRLAAQGVRFTHFYVNGSVCSPTRGAFLTGRFPARLGLHGHLSTPEQNRQRGMPDALDPALPTVAKALRDAGYATGHFGKWHLGPGTGPHAPDAYGFQASRIAGVGSDPEFNLWRLDARPASSARIVDEAIAFIEKHRDRPFYVQAWFLDPHATLNPTDEQMAPYEGLVEKGLRFKSPAQIFNAVVTDLDAQIGRLLKRLDELDLARNTIVFFTSDNGPEDLAIRNAAHSGVGSAGPFRGRKRSLYEGGIRVPGILRWPAAAPAGRVDGETVLSAADFFPTLCALAGVPLPKDHDLDGEDLAAAFRGRPAPRTRPLMWEWRFRVFGHVSNRCPILAIREGPWKLLLNPDRSRVELYDITACPGENDNVADAHPDVVNRLAERVTAWQATLPKGPFDPGAGSDAYPWPK